MLSVNNMNAICEQYKCHIRRRKDCQQLIWVALIRVGCPLFWAEEHAKKYRQQVGGEIGTYINLSQGQKSFQSHMERFIRGT